MKSIHLGRDIDTGNEVRLPKSSFSTHYHLIGGTGKGKTTAIHTFLRPLLRDPGEHPSAVIVDRLGNLSDELLLWMASEEFCTDDVRRRLLYIEPAREDIVMPFNPLIYDTPAHGYYKVERATEIILRAWESVNIEAMPRLARWVFNAFWAVAQLGMTIADCCHLLLPGSPYHTAMLNLLPARLKAEWAEIAGSRSGEVLRILDSSRNRLKPYFESDILRRMFGTTDHRLDFSQFMRDGRIVLINLASRNRLGSQLANTIGGLILNEVIATARNMPPGERRPMYVFLDEFQNFVGPDIEHALPEVRQLGLKLILSHQSFSQLERGDYDLTSMIFQTQSRMIFGIQGEDADLLANELASITYDPRKIKEEIYSRRQLVSGHTKIELTSWSESDARADSWNETYGENWNRNENEVKSPQAIDVTKGSGRGSGENKGRGAGGSATHTAGRGGHETLVPEYDEFLELASRSYVTFDEQRAEWAKKVRNLATGQCLLRLVDRPGLHHVAVKRSAPGPLKYDLSTIRQHFSKLLDNMQRLVEENFATDLFLPAAQIDRDIEQRLESLLKPRLTIPVNPTPKDTKPPFS